MLRKKNEEEMINTRKIISYYLVDGTLYLHLNFFSPSVFFKKKVTKVVSYILIDKGLFTTVFASM